MFRFIQFSMEVVSVELQLNNQSVASFNYLFFDTDLRLSSLHFAISSAVSSLILLAPGAWFCKQEEKKKPMLAKKNTLNPTSWYTAGCFTYIFPVDADYFFMSHEAAVGHGTLQKRCQGGGQ